MNREALLRTEGARLAHYWSRSRHYYGRRASIGSRAEDTEIRVDCDTDAILLLVDQEGGIACHTGRNGVSTGGSRAGWREVEPVLKEPKAIYGDVRASSAVLRRR